MSDTEPTFDPKAGVAEPLGNCGPAGPVLRMVGYCADCGTWDEHGPTCIACGYDFSGGGASLPSD